VCQSYHAVASYGGPALVNPGGTGEPYSINPLFPYFLPLLGPAGPRRLARPGLG